MSGLFHEIEDAKCILSSNGVYRQTTMYRRGDLKDVYAKHSGGYIRLMANGGTSTPKVRWDYVEQRSGVTVTKGKFPKPEYK